ncbi:MAG: hypothetical protein Q8N44_20220 [Rubrivivax sp.]|nr:hypothetical protein [Rubrivivax sp.]
MKPTNTGPASSHDAAKHPSPLGSQQAVAEKAANSAASVKARVDSKNMLRISANVTGDFGNVTDLRLGAGLRG